MTVALMVEQLWQPVPGGSGTYIRELAQHLVPRTSVIGVAAGHVHPAGRDWAVDGPVRHVPLPRELLYEAWQRVPWPRVEWTVPAADVVHATTWAVPRTRRPLVVTVHDLAFLAEPEHFSPHGVRFFRRALDRTLAEATAVIVPSEASRTECISVGFAPERLHVVPHGGRRPATSAASVRQFADRHGIDGPYVLWVGTREPRKNLATVLKAWPAVADALPGTTLVLVGPSGWGPDEALTGSARRDDVRVLGHVSRAELDAAYAGARAFCFPSIREGFGLPVLEAMSSGVPVVTSAGTACAEVAGDAGILVEPLDADQVAHGVVRACTDEHDVLSDRSRLRASLFTWQDTAARTAAVYRSSAR